MPDWRHPPTAIERKFMANDTAIKIEEQWTAGIDKYGLTFVGDPIDQLDEELRDAKVYSNYARRKINEAVALLMDVLKQPSIDHTLRGVIDRFVNDHRQVEPKEDPFDLLKQVRTIQGLRLVRRDPAVLDDKMLDKIELCLRQHGFGPANCVHGDQCDGSGPECAPDRGVGEVIPNWVFGTEPKPYAPIERQHIDVRGANAVD